MSIRDITEKMRRERASFKKRYGIDKSTYYNHKNPVGHLYTGAKFRAKKNNLPFTIEKEDIIIPEFCPVLGIKLKTGTGRQDPASASIDRIDNKLGYTKGNIKVISFRANSLKSNGTLDELKALVSYLERYL